MQLRSWVTVISDISPRMLPDDAGEDRLDEAALGRVRPGVFDAVRKADVALAVRTVEPFEQMLSSFPGDRKRERHRE